MPGQCHGHPCMHGGTCTEGWNRYICDCSQTSFTGATCGDGEYYLCTVGSYYTLTPAKAVRHDSRRPKNIEREASIFGHFFHFFPCPPRRPLRFLPSLYDLGKRPLNGRGLCTEGAKGKAARTEGEELPYINSFFTK